MMHRQYFNAADGKNIFWVNGKMIGEKILKVAGKKYGFNFGDGSGTVAGAVDIESIGVYQVN